MWNFILKYDSFSFQSVIYSLLFIVVDFTSIFLVILNSNYWLGFILIFYVQDSKFHILYAVSFIYRFLVLVVLPSHPFKASLCLSKVNGLIAPSLSKIFVSVVFLGFLISHECERSFGSLLSLEIISHDFVFLPYIIRGNHCPPLFSMWW